MRKQLNAYLKFRKLKKNNDHSDNDAHTQNRLFDNLFDLFRFYQINVIHLRQDEKQKVCCTKSAQFLLFLFFLNLNGMLLFRRIIFSIKLRNLTITSFCSKRFAQIYNDAQSDHED